MLRMPYPSRVVARITSWGKQSPLRAWDDKARAEVGLSGKYVSKIWAGDTPIPSNRTAMNFGMWPVYLDIHTGDIIAMPIETETDVEKSREFRGLIDQEKVLGTLDMKEVYARLREDKE